MARTAAQVAAWAERQKDLNTSGWGQLCLKLARMSAGAPGCPPGAPDAKAGWARTKYKHRGDRTVPRGGIVWYAGGRHGHVAVSAGDGDIYSNDIVQFGHVDRVPLSRPEEKWGEKYLGWSEDVNGVRIDFDGDSDKVAPKHVVNGDGKVTINGKVYPDIGYLYVSSVNAARKSGQLSRGVFRVQVWLRNQGYWPKDGDRTLDGRWDQQLQAAFDKFRWDHRNQLGITSRGDAGGSVGLKSLTLLRKLEGTPNYPVAK